MDGGGNGRGETLRRGRRTLWAALVLTLWSAFSSTARAAQPQLGTATASAQAQAVLVETGSILHVTDLDFGLINSPTTAGTVVIDPTTGACSVTGGAISFGGCANAQFVGRSVRTVRVQLVNSTNLTGPGTTMVLDNLTVSSIAGLNFVGHGGSNGKGIGLTQGNGNAKYEVNTAGGIFTFAVGGTLHVNANQAPGLYQGTVTITVQFQ